MTTLSPPVRRLLAIALLAVVLAIPYQLLVHPVLEKRQAYDRTIADQTELLARYRRIAAGGAALQARLERLKSDPASSDAYLSGESEALVAAQLQNRIKGIVETSGGNLTSTQILPASDDGTFRRISVRVRMTSDVDAMRQIFYALEADQPYVFVNSVDINARETRRTRRRESADDSVELNTTFDVYGYMKAG